MGDKEYLVLMGKGNLYPLKEKFKALGGFYTTFCWAFPSSSETALSEIIKHLPNIEINRLPLPIGVNLESYKQSFSSLFFRKKLKQVENEISQMKDAQLLPLGLSEDSIGSLSLDETVKEELLTKFQEKEELAASIQFAEGMAKALSVLSETINIKFLGENETNFLLAEAPPIPRLVDYTEGNEQKILIRKGITVMFCGAGGVGKTHSLTQLALCITSGAPWFGVYPIYHSGYVFLGLGENSIDDIHHLLKKTWDGINRNNPTFSDKDPVEAVSRRLAVCSFMGFDASFVYGGKQTRFYESFLQELIRKEPEDGWSCIILDPIARFLGADAETDNAAATNFISLLERIILDLKGKPTIIFGHHMNKSGVSGSNTDQAAARGSSALTDGSRQQFNLEKVKKSDVNLDCEEIEIYEPNVVNLRMVKSNFTSILPVQKLEKDEFGCLQAAEDKKEPKIISKSEKGKEKGK